MRKIVRRRNLYKFAAILCFLLLALFLYFYESKEDIHNDLKISIMERSIRSFLNQGECVMPILPVDNPEIMKFYKPTEKLNCGNPLDDWVTCDKSICFVKPEITSMFGEVTCSYTDLIRKTDYRVKYGETTKTKSPYILQASDFVKVACNADAGKSWYGMACGIRDSVQIPPPSPHLKRSILNKSFLDGHLKRKQQQQQQLELLDVPLHFNVLIVGFDSMSRNAVIRKLPKTYAYLTEHLGSIVLKGYNIVGDGTPQALVPLLTGYTELELPEVRHRKRYANYVDVYPMIWKEYKMQGYYTSFNEDVPNIGTFTYRMKGFDQQPVDHYLRTYYIEAQNIWSSSAKFCIGHQPDHVVMLDYTKNFMLKYKDAPKFAFSFHGGLSHDSINQIGAADDDIVTFLRSLQVKALLQNTIFVFMADHGNRFSEVRATLQGKQEERLPFFSFAFPEAFQRRFPQQYANFVENAERLTTPFDVHATLQHILRLQREEIESANEESDAYSKNEGKGEKNLNLVNDNSENNNENMQKISKAAAETAATATQASIKISTMASERAISLFNPIPKNRSCADAYIEPHWCSCLNWQPVDLNVKRYEILGNNLADSIISTINNANHDFKHLCAKRYVQKITWAMRLQPRNELLRYKNTKDLDGFLADLSDHEMKTPIEMYQMQIVVGPGDSLFEATIRYDPHTLVATTKLSEISRIDRYGAQANCIYNVNPELRKYCYCKV